MDINSPINYRFPYAWNSENMSGRPQVNMLLKELIERNYVRAKSLLENGATFKGIDKTTLRRCLFEFLEDYNLIKFMIDNGFNAIYFYTYPRIASTSVDECIDRAGYCWSLTGRAFMLGKRNLLELLFANRFEPGCFRNNGKAYSLDGYAMRNNHFQLIDILLSHGYPKSKLVQCIDYCDRDYSESCQYVMSYPDIQWKSYGLGALEKDIPIPEKPVFKPFMFNKTKQRLTDEYNRAMQWYQKEVSAKEAYMKRLPKKDLEIYFKNKQIDKEFEKELNSFYAEIIEEGRKEALKKAGQQVKAQRGGESNQSRSNSNSGGSYKGYEEDLKEMEMRRFSFVDAEGNYRKWGEGFIDCKGNYVPWGGTFVDGAGNYVKWGNSFVDGSGSYRRWGDDFVDGAGNYVHVP